MYCTEGARTIALERYPGLTLDRTAVISNGYDEGAFQAALALPPVGRPEGKRVLLHSGTVYLGPDRDPTCVLLAIRSLVERGLVTPRDFELRLRDPSNEARLCEMARDLGVGDLVAILPSLPYREALSEMLAADALLLLQGQTSNPAIPAKLYEYLRARRPIIACAHADGDTARTLARLGVRTVASMTSVDEVAELLSGWLADPHRVEADLPPVHDVEQFSRERLTRQFAAELESVAD
jgi:hypothetical protein